MAEAKTPKKGADKAPKNKGSENVAAAGAVSAIPEFQILLNFVKK